MKKSVHTYRILITTALILFCIAIHQNLDAGFHVTSFKKEVREYKPVEKAFVEDNFLLKALLRLSW
ncbi:MAG: hypothetical protein ACTHMM_21815 [Agriterribacter sp.]